MSGRYLCFVISYITLILFTGLKVLLRFLDHLLVIINYENFLFCYFIN